MFTGFPEAALDFYDDLEADNTRSFWTAHADVYATCVRTPMKELADALAEDFGDAKLFRPHRDVRFSKDKSPYKTYQDMQPSDWNNVISVQITLTFSNPLWTAANRGQGNMQQTVQFSRVVNIMRQTGV